MTVRVTSHWTALAQIVAAVLIWSMNLVMVGTLESLPYLSKVLIMFLERTLLMDRKLHNRLKFVTLNRPLTL
jgi:hypothetical protein